MTQNKEKIPNNMVLPKKSFGMHGWHISILLGTLPNNYDQVSENIVKYAKKVDKMKASLKMRECLT